MSTIATDITSLPHGNRRQQAKLALIATATLIGMFLMAGFAMDLAIQFGERCRVQRAADAAAMAAARQLSGRHDPFASTNEAVAASLRKTALTAAANAVVGAPRRVFGIETYAPVGEVVMGRFDTTQAGQNAFQPDHPARCNAVRVRLRSAPAEPTGPRRCMASFLGAGMAEVAAEATAVFCDDPRGFRVAQNADQCSLLPLAMHFDAWQAWLDGAGEDAFRCDLVRGTVAPGPDGVRELLLSASADGGNFGNVRIGNPGSGTPDLWRQIRYGPSAEDLAQYGGQLSLSEDDGTLELLSPSQVGAGMKTALADIVGQARTVMLYRDAVPQARGTRYTIVGFVGVRLMDYCVTNDGQTLRFQPSEVVDATALAGRGKNCSWYVRQPVRLVR